METAVLYAMHKMHLINFNQLQTAFDSSVIIECITKKEREREKRARQGWIPRVCSNEIIIYNATN